MWTINSLTISVHHYIPSFCMTTTDIDVVNVVKVVGFRNDVEEKKKMDPKIIIIIIIIKHWK